MVELEILVKEVDKPYFVVVTLAFLMETSFVVVVVRTFPREG